MHGQQREEGQQKWHMRPGPSQRQQNDTEANSGCVNYFFKAGRKIAVGDCAFFGADNSPLFIGIIKKLSADEGCNLKLTVNLLYRVGDINLDKGACLDAAPNEIFYSFNRDEISAASLLHPCKVAFLQKGVELPSSVSSFVCRRVYDTANKRLYWLTDQDYTDEHQAEVDQLLGRFKHEMQTAAPSEGPSQRATRSPSPLKPETVNAQGKGKKRLRTDQNQDTSKREKLEKVEASDSKRDCTLKYEDFANVANKHGGIANMLFTEQLFQAMLQEQRDSVRKPVNVMSRRTSLASIIAATEKEDCLTHFVQLGGLRILNDWLEEVHQGKLGDGSFNEGDAALEEFLLTLIQALEKLPVDLDALKNCNVGKSVNKLRSHRSSEIRQKARKLVDMWKQRVNAEIKSSDEAKSGANTAINWPSRPVTDTHSSKLQSGKSNAFVKPATNGSNLVGDTKVNPQPAGGFKFHSGLTVSKENSLKSHVVVTNDVLSVVKEEKSCSSGQSQSNSQSWCSGSGKGVGSIKEEVKTLSVAPAGTKISGTMLRNHGHSSKNYSTVTYTSLQKDIVVGRHKTPAVERMSSASLLEKGASDGARVENINSQRLIVRLPNPARSPSRSVSTGSIVDGSAVHNSRASPPGSMGRHDHLHESKTVVANSPDTSGDTKSVRCNGISGANTKEGNVRSGCAKTDEAPCKHMSSEHRSKDVVRKCLSDAQEVMVKKASVSSSMSPGSLVLDSVEGGIDLLASVAACEVFENEKSFSGSTACEGQPISADSTVQSESTHLKGEKQRQGTSPTCHLEPAADCHKDTASVHKMEHLAMCPKFESSCLIEDKALEDRATGIETDSVSHGSPLAMSSIASDSEAVCCEAPAPISNNCGGDHTLIGTPEENKHLSVCGPPVAECQASSPASSPQDTSSLAAECEDVARTTLGTISLTSLPSTCPDAEESLAFYEDDALELARQVAKEIEQEVERLEAKDGNLTVFCNAKLRSDEAVQDAKSNQTLPVGDAISSVKDCSSIGVAPDIASEGTCAEDVAAAGQDKCLSGRVPEVDPMPCKDDEGKIRQHEEPEINSIAAKDVTDLKESAPLIEDRDELIAATDVVIAEQESFVVSKLPSLPKDNVCGGKEMERPVFDLNEGLIADEVQANGATHSILCTPSPILSSADPPSGAAIQTSSLAAPITVVAASKGAFIPPSNLTKTKGELGWKGSAATSAFRPAEPRRVADMSHPSLDAAVATCGSINVPSQCEKQTRFLDIDLNVADERFTEDICTESRPLANEPPTIASNEPWPSRPELDLNRLDGNDENMCHVMSIPRDSVVTAPTRSCAPPQTVSRVILDFDLNDGLGLEESEAEEVSSYLSHNEVSAHRSSNPASSGIPITGKMRQNTDISNAAPWYSASSLMPAAMAMPAFSAGRSESSYPVVAAAHGSKPVMTMGHNSSPFSTDLYRGSGIPSLAASYSASMPASFSYGGFPFGASFPYTSASYNMGSTPPIPTTNASPFLTANPPQLVSAGAAMSPYGRPYLMGGIRDISGADFSASWARPSLDLNSGPDLGMDPDARDGRPNVGLSQLSYQQAGSLGGTVKRKEPEGGYDPFRSGFKQMAWR